MVSDLWSSTDPQKWLQHLDAAKERLQALQDDRLIELEEWFWETLPSLISGRDPPHIVGKDLVTLVEWKLKRGKWRPKLLDYAKSAKEDDVRETSLEAFKSAAEISKDAIADAALDTKPIKDALQPLISLKGVGPATASAIVTAFCPWAPFMSDEAMAAALKGPKEYTMARYLEFAHALRLKADKLAKELGRQFSAQDVERALFSEAAPQKKPAKKPTGKRKR